MNLPRGIRQRGNSFHVDVTLGGTRKTGTAPNLEAALYLQARLRAELLGLEVPAPSEVLPPPPNGWTLKEAIAKTFTDSWAGSKSETTHHKNSKQLLEFFGENTQLHTIDRDYLDRFVAHLEAKGNSNATINRKLACLSKVMSVACDYKALTSKPKFPRKREPQGRQRYLTPAEEINLFRLLKQWGKQDHLEACIVLVDTGMRCGELFGLEGRDITGNLLILWDTKNGTNRSIPMTTRVSEVITRRYLKYGEGKLFPYNHGWLRHVWDRARAHLGYSDDPQFVVHTLRHTCISRLVQAGVPLRVVQEWAGHKTLQITMKYAHLAPENLTEAVKALEQTPNTPSEAQSSS